MRIDLWLGLGLALFLTTAGCSKPSLGLPKVGFAQFTSTSSLDQLREGFVKGLAEEGFVDGKTVEIDFQNAQSDAGTMSLVMQKLATSVDVVGLCSTQALQAAIKSVKDKPVIFCGVIDPVAAGAATTISEPKPNITGVYNPFPVTEGVEMIHKFMPAVKKIGTLYDPSEPFFGGMHEEAKKACAKNGLEFIVVTVSSSNDIVTGMQALKAKGVEAVLQLPSNTVNQGVDGQIKTAGNLGLPMFSLQPDQLEKGIVATVGVDLEEAGAQAGRMAGKVLKGEKTSKFPLETAKLQPIATNPAAAKQFGITLPAN